MDPLSPGCLARLHRDAHSAIHAGRCYSPERHLIDRTVIWIDVTEPRGTIIVVKAVCGSDGDARIFHGGVLFVTVGLDAAP